MSTLTSKYQATIPRAIRDVLALGVGDRIEFTVETDGVRVRRARPEHDELHAIDATLAPEWNSASDDIGYADL